MSRRFLNSLFGPQVPVWACELTPEKCVVVGASNDRRRIQSHACSDIAAGALVPGLQGSNLMESPLVRAAVGKALDAARFVGSEIVLVVPDDAVRVALVDVDSFPSAEEEQLAFIRWRLKKNVAFDVNSSRVTWDRTSANGAIRLVAALSPESVIRPYEEIFESFGLHAGLVVPSTLAALGLLDARGGDVMFIKKTNSAITTSVLIDGEIRFYRKVPGQSLYEAAFPTFMYYQDRLEGNQLDRVVLCGEDIGSAEEAELEQGVGSRVEPLSSIDIDDIYKPALGALQQ